MGISRELSYSVRVELPRTNYFADIVQLAQEHHNPKPSVIMRRFRFNTCVRQEGESITKFVTRLRDMASHCLYGDSATELIRDRLVCGVRDDTLQRTLLAVSRLTFDKAFELALLHDLRSRVDQVLFSWESLSPHRLQTPFSQACLMTAQTQAQTLQPILYDRQRLRSVAQRETDIRPIDSCEPGLCSQY